MGGAHEEVGDDGVLLLGAHAGEGGIVREALAHEGADARDLRGGHRGARQALVLVAEVGRHDVAAGGRDLRLEGQVGGHAPRRELRGRRVVRGQHDAGVRDGHGDIGSVGGGQGFADRLAILLGDGHRRHRRGRAEDRLVGRGGLVRVSDHEGRRSRREGRQVARLELLGHGRAVAGVRTALVLEDDHAGEIGSRVLFELVGAASAGVDDAVGLLSDVAQTAHGLALAVEGSAVGNLTIAQAHVGQGLLVVDGGNSQGGLVGGGFAERTRVGVGRERLVLAGVVAVGVGEGVAARGVDGDTSSIQLLVHAGEDAARVAAHAGVVAQGQVDDVGLDDERIVEGCQQGAVGHRAVRVRCDLSDDDLRVGRGALQDIRVGGRDRGDVRAVGQVFRGMGDDVGVVVRVVVGEGDLAVDVRAGSAVRELARKGLHVGLAHAHLDAVHRAGEGVVVGLQARVDDFDDLTIALEGDLVHARHRQGRGVLEDGRTAPLRPSLHRLVDTFDEGGLYALDLLDRGEGGAGCLDGEADERVGVVAHGRNLRAGHDALDRGGDARLDLVARGLRGTTGRPVLELDDDRRRGVVRLLHRGGVGQGHSPSFGLADGQEGVLDSRPRLRVLRRGVGRVGGEDTARLGARCERRDAHAGQGEGGDERECRGRVMGHQGLTYVSTR